jgi:hypothetical protein
MTWLQRYLGAILTAAALLIGGAIGYGRMQEICTQVMAKADRETVQRETDRIQTTLSRIEQKLDDFIMNHQK